MKTIVVVILCLSTLAAAQDKKREWKKGTLLEVTMEKHSRIGWYTTGGDGYATGQITEKRDDSTYYRIEADDVIYVAKRTLKRHRDKQLKVTTNGPIQYSISGDDFYLLDEEGQEHKLSLEEKIAKPKQPL